MYSQVPLALSAVLYRLMPNYGTEFVSLGFMGMAAFWGVSAHYASTSARVLAMRAKVPPDSPEFANWFAGSSAYFLFFFNDAWLFFLISTPFFFGATMWWIVFSNKLIIRRLRELLL